MEGSPTTTLSTRMLLIAILKATTNLIRGHSQTIVLMGKGVMRIRPIIVIAPLAPIVIVVVLDVIVVVTVEAVPSVACS